MSRHLELPAVLHTSQLSNANDLHIRTLDSDNPFLVKKSNTHTNGLCKMVPDLMNPYQIHLHFLVLLCHHQHLHRLYPCTQKHIHTQLNTNSTEKSDLAVGAVNNQRLGTGQFGCPPPILELVHLLYLSKSPPPPELVLLLYLSQLSSPH